MGDLVQIDTDVKRKMRELGKRAVEKRRQNRDVHGRRDGSNPPEENAEQLPLDTDTDALLALAEREIRRQLRHRNPAMRRDAAKIALELELGKFAKDGDEPITEVVFRTIPLTPAEFEPPPAPPEIPGSPFE